MATACDTYTFSQLRKDVDGAFKVYLGLNHKETINAEASKMSIVVKEANIEDDSVVDANIWNLMVGLVSDTLVASRDQTSKKYTIDKCTIEIPLNIPSKNHLKIFVHTILCTYLQKLFNLKLNSITENKKKNVKDLIDHVGKINPTQQETESILTFDFGTLPSTQNDTDLKSAWPAL
jgi:hypothetical protein